VEDDNEDDDEGRSWAMGRWAVGGGPLAPLVGSWAGGDERGRRSVSRGLCVKKTVLRRERREGGIERGIERRGRTDGTREEKKRER
jgi:hypothetical protein